MGNVSDEPCRENQNTHFESCNVFFQNRAVYEIIWKNFVQRDRPQKRIWRIAYWLPKATNTHTGCVIITDLTLQIWLSERASVLRYTYFACLV